MNTKVVFNEKAGKYDFFVGTKLVSRGSKEFIEKKLAAHNAANGVSENMESKVDVQKPKFSINKRFDFLKHFTKMVAKKQANSLIVSGPGGLGKTYTVMNTLEKCGLVEDTIGSLDSDYIVIKGFTTAKMLYRTLWENNGKVVVFDDCDSAYRDPIGMNILKGALDSSDVRIISWNAEFSEKEELPNRFEFVGRCIFISNYSMDKVPQAIQSRSMRVSLDMTTAEKVERIETIFNEEVDADESEKASVINVLKKNADKASDLNVRAAMNLLKIRQSTESDSMFEELALYSLTA